MITFFANVRPFVGEFCAIQQSAIASWTDAVPDAQVIITGDVEGVADLDVEYIPGVQTNEQGVELVADIWRIGIENAKYEWACALNSDNMILPDIVDAVKVLEYVTRPFVVGQRWNMSRGDPVSTKLNPMAGGMDWFLFRRDTVPVEEIPPFAVGQGRYDRWLLWAALEKWKMIVIDATKDVTVTHITHKKVIGPECRENTQLFQASGAYSCTVGHARFVLENGKLGKRAQ